MNPYNVTGPTATEVAQVESIVSQRLKGSFLWMVVGLLTTIGVGVAALANPNWLRFAYQNFSIILLVELGVVFLFSARAYSANVMTLKGIPNTICNGCLTWYDYRIFRDDRGSLL